ncbi:hypothetical protein ES705_16175 [subsurface metagenome]
MNNFAVLTIAYSHTATSIIISIGTNTPCHLTCYYTDKEPGSHRTSRNQRGLTLPWGVYYCFVAWQSVEQIEPGDTLIHTFNISPWSYCQTKWLAFRGTVAGELSPSVSPIFQHHHSATLYQHYNTGETSAYRFTATTWVAQTFTVQISHTINQVRIMLNRYGLPGEARLGIWRTDPAGHPTGYDLIAATFNANALILHPGKEWKALSLPTYYLTAAKYAIVLRAPYGSSGNDIGWWVDGSSPTYTLGNFERGSSSGTRWSAMLYYDAMFEEWGTPA